LVLPTADLVCLAAFADGLTDCRGNGRGRQHAAGISLLCVACGAHGCAFVGGTSGKREDYHERKYVLQDSLLIEISLRRSYQQALHE
jgi:hypothetical protein